MKNATATLIAKKNVEGAQAETLKCEGVFTSDRTKWSREVSSFYSDLHKEPSAHKGIVDAEMRQGLILKQRERLALIRADRHWKRELNLDIPLWMMLQTRAKHSNSLDGAPSADGITWRCLASFPAPLVDTLRKAFNDRINAKASHRGPVKQWAEVVVRLIPKVHRPDEVKDWRPISLSSCLQKWFGAILTCLLEEMADPLGQEATGFRPGRQVGEITVCMRLGLEKASLWGENLVILQADVRKAFDSINHEILIRCLESYRARTRLIHAIIQELSETEMCLHMGQVMGLIFVLLVSAGKQGSSETPSLWNRMLDTALGRARLICLEAGLGALFVKRGGTILFCHTYFGPMMSTCSGPA